MGGGVRQKESVRSEDFSEKKFGRRIAKDAKETEKRERERKFTIGVSWLFRFGPTSGRCRAAQEIRGVVQCNRAYSHRGCKGRRADRGADRALEGADKPGQTGPVTLSPQWLFVQKLRKENKTSVIMRFFFPTKFGLHVRDEAILLEKYSQYNQSCISHRTASREGAVPNDMHTA